MTDIIEEDNEKVVMEIMAQIQKVNRKAISSAQKVSNNITIYEGEISWSCPRCISS